MHRALPFLRFTSNISLRTIAFSNVPPRARLRTNAIIAGGTSCALCIIISAFRANRPKNVPFSAWFPSLEMWELEAQNYSAVMWLFTGRAAQDLRVTGFRTVSKLILKERMRDCGLNLWGSRQEPTASPFEYINEDLDCIILDFFLSKRLLVSKERICGIELWEENNQVKHLCPGRRMLKERPCRHSAVRM